MTRSKRATLVLAGLQQRRVSFLPRRGLKRITARIPQQAERVVARPAPVGRVYYALETGHAEPRGAFVDSSPPTVGSFPGQFGARDTRQGVSECLLGVGELYQKQVLLCVGRVT